MRICMVAKTADPRSGGLGRHVYELAESLSQRGNQVTILTREDSEVPDTKAEVRKVSFLNLRQDVLNSYSSLPGMVNYLRKNSSEFDVVHGHGLIGFSNYLASLIGEETEFVYTLHGVSEEHTSRKWLKPLAKLLFYPENLTVRSADGLIAVSEDTKKKAIEKYDLKPEDLRVIHNGVDLDKFERGWEFDNKILFVGHLISRKGPERLLEAFEILSQEFPELELIYVGNGRMREDLEKRVDEENLSEKVNFLKNISEERLSELYSESIFCMPSLYEGFGMVYIEAMASGAPVIATEGTAISEVINDRENGILTEAEPEDISDSIRELIEDGEMRKRIGKKAKETSKEFSWNEIAGKTEEYYREILE